MGQKSDGHKASWANIPTLEALKLWLIGRGFDISQWGYGPTKTVEHLWQEILDGEVLLQDSPPLRIVSVVQVVIRKRNAILIEAEQILQNHQKRLRNRLPTEKMRLSEKYYHAARRCLQEELRLNSEDFEIIFSTYQKREETEESSSYPGLWTCYTLHRVEVRVCGLPDADFWTEEADPDTTDGVKKHHWVWRSHW